MPSPEPLISPMGSSIYYQGLDLQKGILPAVFYFALSAETSLFEDPFNQSVLRLVEQGIRVFSWDLPFHGTGQNPRDAMHQWSKEFLKNPSFISDFLLLCQNNIEYLIEQKFVDPALMAVSGLSRGGFIATHLAAIDPRIEIVLGFAPLTSPQAVVELNQPFFDAIGLPHLVDRLVNKKLRFYIGNHDMRVGTDACYQFIRLLTKAALKEGIRSPTSELILYPSIGHKGHGTPPEIFYEGADWLKKQLKQSAE